MCANDKRSRCNEEAGCPRSRTVDLVTAALIYNNRCWDAGAGNTQMVAPHFFFGFSRLCADGDSREEGVGFGF